MLLLCISMHIGSIDAVVGGGEDLCAKHFQRRAICGCPTSIENSSQDIVAHTHILLPFHLQNSASAGFNSTELAVSLSLVYTSRFVPLPV